METRVNPLQLLKRKAIVKPKAPIFYKIKTKADTLFLAELEIAAESPACG
jgi:hypothetical protein